MKLGHVSLDGSKVDANASKHKAMSYGRMETEEQRLESEIRDLLARAEDQDPADDARLGAGVPETNLPAELKRREDRLARIRAAKAALEADARETRAAQLREQADRARAAAACTEDPAEQARVSRRAERREAAARALDPDGARRAAVHHPKATRGGAPQASAQRNFTDPASRMMEGGGGFTQAYNGHIAVDDEWHVIVGQGDSNQAPDTQYFIPMLERVQSTELH